MVVDVRCLPWGGGLVRLSHYRIDHAHSNSHSAGMAMGRPRDPDAQQVAALRAYGELDAYAPDQVVDAEGGADSDPQSEERGMSRVAPALVEPAQIPSM